MCCSEEVESTPMHWCVACYHPVFVPSSKCIAMWLTNISFGEVSIGQGEEKYNVIVTYYKLHIH